MQHCDPQVLSLVALGEHAEAEDAEHLAACTQCQAEVEHLAAVVSAVRVEVPAGPPVAPPATVWQQIAAQTGVRVTPAPPDHDLGPPGASAIVVPLEAGRRTGRGRPGQGGAGRRGRDRLLIAVAAGALVLGGVGGSVATRLLSDPAPPVTAQPTPPPVPLPSPSLVAVVAQAPLAGLPIAPTAAGEARVIKATDGKHLVVDVSRLAALDGAFYEVWLIDKSIKKMVPVGILRGEGGQFVIPTGLDLAEYPIVDISVQKPGTPEHSGKSVLRGTLPA